MPTPVPPVQDAANRRPGDAANPWATLQALIRRELLWGRHLAQRARRARTHPLRYLFLEVTRRCNLACQYCGSDCTIKSGAPGGNPDASSPEPGGALVTRPELDAREWITVIRELVRDFDPPEVMVAVTGGEPLLKEGIDEIFAELRRRGFPYGMVTNGTLLDADRARRLVALGIGSISLSMDAPPAVNDRLRGKGVSAKVEQAIGHLRAAGYRGRLEIITTVTRPALPLLDEMRRYVARLRVPLWRVSPVMPIGRAARRPDLVPGPAEIRVLLEFVRAARQDRHVPGPEFSEEGFLGHRFEGNVRPYLCECSAGITIGGIRADGRIGACPELGDAFLQGDIRTERFADVWENRYQVMRDRSWTHQGACAECAQFLRCGGGALHLYPEPGAPFLRCLYQQARAGEGG